MTPGQALDRIAELSLRVHASILWTRDEWPDDTTDEVRAAWDAIGWLPDTWKAPHALRREPRALDPARKRLVWRDDCDGYAGCLCHDALLYLGQEVDPAEVDACQRAHPELAAWCRSQVPDLAAHFVVGTVETPRGRAGHARASVRVAGEAWYFDPTWGQGPWTHAEMVALGWEPVGRREYTVKGSLGPWEPARRVA